MFPAHASAPAKESGPKRAAVEFLVYRYPKSSSFTAIERVRHRPYSGGKRAVDDSELSVTARRSSDHVPSVRAAYAMGAYPS